MKRVLITGEASYIGMSVEKYLNQFEGEYEITTISVRTDEWKNHDFSKYDVVYHVAGIAHVSNDKKLDDLYFKVNRDLAKSVADKAKNDKVHQFIFMSSMIIYGKDNKIGNFKHIDEHSYAPINAYGQSKLDADLYIQSLNDENFKTVVIRTPIVYGPNSKGNFPRLQKLALKMPIFPNIKNQRSMIYIDNLAAYIKEYIDAKISGVVYPQNNEYVQTKDIIRITRELNGKKYRETKLFNWIIILMGYFIPTINKVFGNKTYENDIKNEKLKTLEKSLLEIKNNEIKKVLFVYNSTQFANKFTFEIIQKVKELGHQVMVVGPNDGDINKIKNLGCEYHYTKIDRRGMNPLKDFKLFLEYKKIIKSFKPYLIYTFTIKPNIYIPLITKRRKIKVIARVPGLGTTLQKNNLKFLLVKFLYKLSFKHIEHVYFENYSNKEEFFNKVMHLKSSKVITGSGVNLDNFEVSNSFPDKTTFLFIGRLMKEKGIYEFIGASERLKKKYNNDVEILIAGFYEEELKDTIEDLVSKNIVNYLGYIEDPRPLFQKSSCIVLPSYHEGMSNVMLEAQATGRPVIGSDIPGIKETLIANTSGFLVNVKDEDSLFNTMEKFHKLPINRKIEMGLQGRIHVSKNFDRRNVVLDYIRHLGDINEK